MRSLSRSAALLAALVLGSASLSACSDDEPTGPVTIEITFSDGEVTPLGETVDAQVGEPITLKVTADEAGEIHVHSTPEQEIAYDEGTSEHELVIDKAGVVEVESHDLDATIVKLEVR